MPTMEGYFAWHSALKWFCRWQRSSCCFLSMSRRLCSGFETTVMSTPPIFAASSAFSIVVGGRPCFGARMLRWNCVPVNASMSSGGSTWTWKSMIMDVSASLDLLVGDEQQADRHVDAERLGGLQVDDERVPGGELDRQVA